MHIRLVCTHEKVITGFVQSNGGDTAFELHLPDDSEVVLSQQSNGAIACAHQNIAFVCHRNNTDTIGERLLLWTLVFEHLNGEIDSQNVSASGSNIDVAIIAVDQNGVGDAFERTEATVRWSDLAVRQVEPPNTEVVLAGRHQLERVVVEKLDGKCRVVAGRIATNLKPKTYIKFYVSCECNDVQLVRFQCSK